MNVNDSRNFTLLEYNFVAFYPNDMQKADADKVYSSNLLFKRFKESKYVNIQLLRNP